MSKQPTLLLQNRCVVLGATILFCLLVACCTVPLLLPHTYSSTNLLQRNLSPSLTHLFGTDNLGRDICARVFYGMRISLFIGTVAAIIDITIGVLYGITSAFLGGKIDEFLMRVADIIQAIPSLLLAIFITVIIGSSIGTIIVAITITGWIAMARIIRGQILSLKEQDFIAATIAIGASTTRIIFHHLIPNSIGIILTTTTMTIPIAIFTEAFLSFLGIGVQLPIASLGTMAHEGISTFIYYPWQLFFPMGMIVLIIASFNLLGTGFRQVWNSCEKVL
ncbi:MAG: ABC transporter permease [Chlamydiales bacterium]